MSKFREGETVQIPNGDLVQVWNINFSRVRCSNLKWYTEDELRPAPDDIPIIYASIGNRPDVPMDPSVADLMNLTPIDGEDDVMTVAEFKENAGPFNGYWAMFSPDDGTGYWGTSEGYSREHPVFQSGRMTAVPEWATHVVWFNK